MAKPTSPQTDPLERIIEGTMRLAGTLGWRHVSMQDIADETGLPLSEILEYLPTKNAFLGLLIAHIDKSVTAEISAAENSEPPRERLFDVLMTRFEKLSPYRDGIAAILRDSLCDPVVLTKQLCAAGYSMKEMLGAAQIPTSGPIGALRIKGALLLYASTFRVWIRDDSADLSKTMVTLDKALSKADRLARYLPA